MDRSGAKALLESRILIGDQVGSRRHFTMADGAGIVSYTQAIVRQALGNHRLGEGFIDDGKARSRAPTALSRFLPMTALTNVIGSAAAICSIISFAPQMVKIWKERDASSVSLKTYSLTVTAFVLWTTYGVLSSAWPIMVANACALVMSSIVLVMKWRFSRRG